MITMAKLPRLSDYPNIEVEKVFKPGDFETSYFLRIPFEYIGLLDINVAHRNIVNKSSGLVRHLTDEYHKVNFPNGLKIIEGEPMEDSSDKRLFHESYGWHMQKLGIIDKHDEVLVPAYLNGWRDLGQNPWHMLWEQNPYPELCLNGDHTVSSNKPGSKLIMVTGDRDYGITHNNDLNTGRIYSCLVVPIDGNPQIKDVRVDDNECIYTPGLEENLSTSISWAASGKRLVRNGELPKLYDIIEQYYDVAHVFPVSKKHPEEIDGRTDRIRKGELVQRLYNNYPEKFKENCCNAIDEGLAIAEYYFDIVGVNDESFMILHSYGSLEEVANKAIMKGMKDAIIVDEGGSVATWAWYHGPKGGFENCSSYLRPSAISVLGIKLRDVN